MAVKKSFGEAVKAYGVKQVIGYLEKDPETNIPKVLDWLEKHDVGGGLSAKIPAVRKLLADPNNNWNQFVKKLYSDIDVDVRKKMFENFIIHTAMLGFKREDESRVKYNCNIPWAILMDPTSACNLNCVGCWAANYDHALNLTFEELDDIVNQGEDLGVFMYIFSGGEPLVRKKDIIRLCEKHSECMFLSFTNSTLIDEEFADEMLRVKNFIPAISIEGYEEDNDFRRGKGTYKKILHAMKILKDRKLPFGTSLCYTSKNTDVIASDEWFDFMIDQGALFAWVFTYMPVGVNAVPELMVTAEQREKMYYKLREFRKTKAIFTLDFWNDGEYVNGCIAGGRRYCHINANGDIEPCAFIHYSDSNIREKTLVEAFQSPLFMQYKEHQPFNDVHLRPCPLLDNPPALAEMVKKSGAKSTDMEAPEDAEILCAKCEDKARLWAPVADKLWVKSGRAAEQAAKKNASK